jgi:hypothetical protein
VRYVALPSVPLDASAHAEAALLRHGQPWLKPVFADRDWRVWQVRGAAPLGGGAGALTALGTDSFTLHARRRGTIFVRERYTPYWTIVAGAGCVRRAAGGWTDVDVRGAGVIGVAARFSPTRVLDHGPRCTD